MGRRSRNPPRYYDGDVRKDQDLVDDQVKILIGDRKKPFCIQLRQVREREGRAAPPASAPQTGLTGALLCLWLWHATASLCFCLGWCCVRKDAEFLSSKNIMDYSLLVAIIREPPHQQAPPDYLFGPYRPVPEVCHAACLLP